jgi:starch-binding outer membrane protein, SusD/RagB family
MKNTKMLIIRFIIILLIFNSCTNDLDTKPKVELTLEQLLAEDPNAIQGLLSKMYGTFALTGSGGPNTSDINGADKGETGFLRGIINLEDFAADDMKNLWGDDGLDQLTTTSNWTSENKFFRYLYDRVYYTVPNCNNIIRVLGNTTIENKEQYIAELRFLRSLSYYYMIDCFGKGVIVKEDASVTVALPQSTRTEMFEYVESELLEIQNILPQTIGYGRANKAVARMLLAKLYLNAEIYTGTSRYNDALTYSKLVIDEGGYQLAPNFVSLFSGDNNLTEAKNEIIFPLIADPLTSQSYGNTTYLVNGNIKTSTMVPADFGATDGWGGHRATQAWYGLFGSTTSELLSSQDSRAKLFWTDGHNYLMNDYKIWTDGFPCVKFRNSNYIGNSVPTSFSGTDFPLYRLADVYLMYAECVLRDATGGTRNQALLYVNNIRTRSNASTIQDSQLNLQFILDERARELNFEGHRRTDLIRFGKFTGGQYLWPWKGGVVNGKSIPETYNLYPIPSTALTANPNLTQNPGY